MPPVREMGCLSLPQDAERARLPDTSASAMPKGVNKQLVVCRSYADRETLAGVRRMAVCIGEQCWH